jgi:hypothetical protein
VCLLKYRVKESIERPKYVRKSEDGRAMRFVHVHDSEGDPVGVALASIIDFQVELDETLKLDEMSVCKSSFRRGAIDALGKFMFIPVDPGGRNDRCRITARVKKDRSETQCDQVSVWKQFTAAVDPSRP